MMCLASICMMAQGWPANYGGVMLQGFYWDYYDDADWGTWNALKGQANDLEGYIDLIWVPNSARTKNDYCVEHAATEGNGWLKDMGYMPCWWLNHDNTIFGDTEDLKSMINTYKEKGIGIIEDVVINHKNGQNDWCDFPNEEVIVGDKTYKLNWSLADICRNDNGGYVSTMFDVTGAYDTGDDFDGCRDLDHTGANVQQNVKTYLDYLQKELGYAGFRYDMVKGYGPQYVGIYNAYAKPTFSVGEFWDNWDGVTWWINGTKQNGVVQSAAFDFPLKFLINNAFTGDFNQSALNTQGMAGSSEYQRYSVTFVDNHDTYRDGSCMSNTSHVLAANAFILAMPGTPCIFLPHWKMYKKALKKMIVARKAAGITNQSSFKKLDMEGGIGFEVDGTNGNKVLVTLGYVTGGIPSGYKVVVSGDAVNHDFCFYVNEGLEVPEINEPEEQNSIRVYLAQTDNIMNSSLHVWNNNGNLTGQWGAATQNIGYLLTDAGSKDMYPAGTAYINGQAWYYVTFPNQEKINLVLHNQDGQTADIVDITTDIFLSYAGGSNCTDLTSSFAGYPQAWYEEGEICAFFVDDANWGNIHAWAWRGNDNYTGGNWPGQACTFLGYNEFGGKIYKWTYTGDQTTVPEKIIFNKGSNEKQTADCDFKNGAWYNTSNIGENKSPVSTAVAPSTEISIAALGNPTTATNWNGKSEKVAENTGDEMSKAFSLAAGNYIVQAIVRGTNGGSVMLTANNNTASVGLTGLDGASSTVQTNGIIEKYATGANNGWQKVEVAFTLDNAEKVTVTLSSAASTWQLGALKVLPGTTMTKATTGVDLANNTFVDVRGTNDFSFFERGENPNALIKAAAGTLPALLPYNVIVDGTCANLNLTDDNFSFKSNEVFTAMAVSYDRQFTEGQSSTICLPFALTADEAEDAGTFWALGSYDSTTGNINFVKVEEPAANTPYIFVAKANGRPFASMSGKVVPASSLEPVTKGNISFVGVNERKALKSEAQGTTYYGFSGNAFVKVGTNKGANINPFRAYLQTASPLQARMAVTFDGEDDGMMGVQDVTPAQEHVKQQPVYNLGGQRMKTPQKKGLYIIGGKKYFVK